MGLALLCTTATGIATAGQSDYPTFFEKFSFRDGAGAQGKFAGKIDARKRACVVDRKIVLFRKLDGGRKKMGGDRTNRKGRFAIPARRHRPKGARYFARAKPARFKSARGERIRCRAEKSAKIAIR